MAGACEKIMRWSKIAMFIGLFSSIVSYVITEIMTPDVSLRLHGKLTGAEAASIEFWHDFGFYLLLAALFGLFTFLCSKYIYKCRCDTVK